MRMSLPDGVSLLLAPNPSPMTLTGTNTYLLRGSAGCVIIDPGPEIEEHLGAVADEAQKQGGALAILVTHGHPDHVEGAAHLRELTGAPIWAWSRAGSPAADKTISDGERISVGERALRAIFTPGHRYDHVCFLLEDPKQDEGVVFAGDLVAGAGTVVIAPPEGDLNDYLTSLRRILALEPHLLLPGHGPARDDARALLEGYIAHREDRERQLLNALSAEPITVQTLVQLIYTDISPSLHPIAAYSTLAGLIKLERERRVIRLPGIDDTEESSLPERSPLALEGVVGRSAGFSARWRLA
jgi:glyoxylase-like metal-dependent hydrolase (beta-lactamase superfamily II)